MLRTPLVRLQGDTRPGAPEIHLKLENLQPIGSFKLRGAGNAMLSLEPEQFAGGVVTASAGNMAQGIAWHARRMGIDCTVVVPDHAPATKIAAMERLGARAVPVSFERWWQVLKERSYPGLDGHFIHPVSDPEVIAGNGTIGLEILEDLPDVDTILVPYGGGGLSCGIASAVRASDSAAQVIACEVETAAPFSAALEHGGPIEIDYEASFVDGIGGRSVLEEMWPLASELLAGAHVVGLEQVASAIRMLVEHNSVVAEGAGAVPVAAALDAALDYGQRVVCVISGGNIDASKLSALLAGRLP